MDADTKTVTVITGENKIIFIYTKRADLGYTVEYREGSETGTELRTAKTENGKTFGETYTENAAAIEGYTVDADTKTVTVTTGENKIIFIYTKRADLGYTVEYREGSETGTELRTAKTENGKTFGETYTENAEVIDGYTVDADTKTVTVTTGENKIIFIYTKRADLSYTVEYREGSKTGTELKDAKTESGKTFGETYTENAAAIEGYTVDADTKTVTVSTGENKIIFIYTKRADLGYTVEYREGSETGTELKDAKTETGKTFGETYTENAEVIDGYTVDADTKTVTVSTGENKIIFIYTKRTDLSYTVEYREGSETGTELRTAKTENGKTFGETYTENAAAIEGYTVDADTKTVTVTTGENKIIFIYTKRADLGYTVEYREGSETGTELRTAKTENGKTFGETYTENAEVIDGYTVDADTKTVTVTTGENKIIFIYTKRADLGYTVEYREGSETGTELKDAKTETGKTFGETYTENAEVIDGYTVDADTKTVTVSTGENKIIFIYTKRTDLSYTVEYREGSETGTELRTAKTENGKTFGETYTENAAAIEGYTVDADTKTVTVTTGENKIIFIYTKRTDLTYTVKYLWTDGMGSGTAIEGVQDKVVENVTFEQEILEEPIEISGYTPVETGKVERRMDKESLTIVFLYYKNVTLTAASDSVVYNGSTQTLSGYTSSEAEAVFEDVTASGSGEDVGGYAVTFSGVSEREQKISKDRRYLLTGTEDGKLTITPAPLTVTTDSDSKVYDGIALTAPGSITGLVNDETVTFTVTGSQTDVGSSTNTYSIVWGNVKAANYSLTEELGTLNVTAQNITPPENPDNPQRLPGC